jgi:hypothetical protein
MLDKLKFWKHDEPADDLGGMNFNTPLDNNEPGLDLPERPAAVPQFRPVEEQPQQHMDPMNMPSFGQPAQQQGYQQYPPVQEPALQQYQQQTESVHPRDVELIISKIETLKASLDHMTTRIEHLERVMNDRKRW